MYNIFYRKLVYYSIVGMRLNPILGVLVLISVLMPCLLLVENGLSNMFLNESTPIMNWSFYNYTCFRPIVIIAVLVTLFMPNPFCR